MHPGDARSYTMLPDQQIVSAEQYTSVDNDGPTEAELSIEEAVQVVLSHDPEDTSGNEEPCTDPSSSAADSSESAVQVVPVSLSKIIDQLHDVQDNCMSRNDLQHITEALGSLIFQAEQQQQHARTQTSIVSFFRQ